MSELQTEILGDKKKVISAKNPQGKNIGSVLIQKSKKSAGSYLSQLSVTEDQRKQGLGTKLLAEAESVSEHPISLEVSADNQNAIDFYLKRGYTICRKITAKNGGVYFQMTKQ